MTLQGIRRGVFLGVGSTCCQRITHDAAQRIGSKRLPQLGIDVEVADVA